MGVIVNIVSSVKQTSEINLAGLVGKPGTESQLETIATVSARLDMAGRSLVLRAAIAASQICPSWSSPSPNITNVVLSEPSSRAASAQPIPKESPMPRLPAEKSTPGVHFMSTCPWQTPPNLRNEVKSSLLRNPDSCRMAYIPGEACPLLMMKRSLSGSSGFCGSTFSLRP